MEAPLPRTAKFAIFVGLCAALVGVTDGIVLMAEHGPICSFDAPCTPHPRFGEGLAYLVISLSAGAIVLILAFIGRELYRSSTEQTAVLRRLERTLNQR